MANIPLKLRKFFSSITAHCVQTKNNNIFWEEDEN